MLETLDNGKPIRETRDIDVPLVARHFYHHAGWAQLMETEFAGLRAARRRRPDHPVELPAADAGVEDRAGARDGQHGGAQAGRVHAADRARSSPRSAPRSACRRGVVNIVTGDGSTGAAIVDHPDVDKIAFTGSTEVGRIIRKATAGTGKKLSLELGGKSPFIVFDDADLDSVVEGVVDAIWFNQGQVCCAGSRLLVQEGIARELPREAARAHGDAARRRSRSTSAIDIGAIVAPVQLERITQLVQQGREEGATMWQPTLELPDRRACFYPPTLFTDVSPATTVAQVEIFGPVLVAMTFRTPEEAVALANNTRYGLAASVWTENINLALDIAPKIKAGVVWINCTNLFDAAGGFGGYRETGFGREGGREGLFEYVKPRWMAEAKKPRSAKDKAARAAQRSVAETGLAPAPQPGSNGLPGIDRTREALRRRQAGAPRRGLRAAGARPEGTRGRRRRPGQPQGHPQRGRGGARGGAAGPGDRAQPRRRSSTTSRRTWRRAPRSSRRVSPR